MKVLLIPLAFVGSVALACPYDDVKDAKAHHPGKAAVEAKAPTPVVATKTVPAKKTDTRVADKSAADARKASPL
jgi:hypothetical protein